MRFFASLNHSDYNAFVLTFIGQNDSKVQSHVASFFIITGNWMEGWLWQRLIEEDIPSETEAWVNK